MKDFVYGTALTVAMMAATPVSVADETAGVIAAANYFDEHWKLFNTEEQAYQRTADELTLKSFAYFAANWSLFNFEDQLAGKTIDNILANNND